MPPIGQQEGVLAGIRVLEIGHFVAAPFCTRLLGDLGAEVIKIEPPGGDPVRQWGEQVDGRSLWWSVHARNKHSIALDLKSEAGRAVALDLAAECDVVVENFRPGQLAKMGLSPDLLRERRPGLIVAHVSGYGQTGPGRDQAAFGVIGEAIGIVAALFRQARFGEDARYQTVDVALTESVLSLMEAMLPEYGALGKVKQPTGGAIATAAPSNAYPTADGEWILIAANSEPLFAKLLSLMNRQDLGDDERFEGNAQRVRHAAALDLLISDWTRSLTAANLGEQLAAADIPASKVYTAADIAQDAQYRARGMVREVDDPLLGPTLHPGIVPHFPDAPGSIRRTGPAIGADGENLARRLLGYDEGQIAALKQTGVLG